MEIHLNQMGASEWDYLCDTARAPMQQRWNYGAVHSALGGKTWRALVVDGGEPVALCQSLSRKFGIIPITLSTRGPVWLAPLTTAQKRRATRLFRRGIHLMTAQTGIRLMSPVTQAILDLSRPETMRAALHGKWRNALKQAENSGLRCRHITCPEKALATLLQRDATQQQRSRYRALPAAFATCWHAISPGDLRLITVSQGGQTVSSALFIRHGNTATYHIGHSTDQGRAVSAQRLALWQAMTDFSQAGVVQLDLGAIDTVNAAGLARFKLGTGAKARSLPPTSLVI